MNYSSRSILAWFHKTLGVDSTHGFEIRTSCPKCGADRFYFNTKKLIGVCHKASCGYTPSLYALIEIVGFPPGEGGIYDKEEEEPEKELPALELPGWPVAEMINGVMHTTNMTALEYLRSRDIPDEIVANWGITCDGKRIYIPIFSEGVLVNYNSRILPYSVGRKYLYAEGRPTGKYILGWEEARDWTQLCLVENTFVSLSYRYDLHCSTTFGSNVSDVQADLISKSRIRRVAILWDEGADKKAEIAIQKLHNRGVKAAFWRINGQPDDHPKEQVIEWSKQVFEATDAGVHYVDFKELEGEQ